MNSLTDIPAAQHLQSISSDTVFVSGRTWLFDIELSEEYEGDIVVVGVLRGYGMYGTGFSLSIVRQCYRADLVAEKTGEEEGW